MREGQNLNFAVPVADLTALVASRPGQFAFPSASHETQGAATTRNPNRGNWLATVPVLNPGSLNAVLTEQDQTLDTGGYLTAYRLAGRRGTSVSISVNSTDFDPFVGVYRLEGDSARDVARDDDSGGGFNAKTSFTFPENGTYFVGVSSVSGRARKTGNYVIKLAQIRNAEVAAPTRGEPSRWLPAGSTDSFTNEFDRTRITPMGSGVYRVWQRSTYATPYTDSGGDTFDVDLRQTDFDCNESRYRTISQIQYLNGTVVWSSSQPRQWTVLAPESVGEEAGAAICAYIRTHGR
jgi:Bacterial pre-peptidase C-terminal domain.